MNRSERACRAKVRFLDKASADRSGRLYGLASYACPHCGGWHTTKKSQGREDDARAAETNAREAALARAAEDGRQLALRRRREGRRWR